MTANRCSERMHSIIPLSPMCIEAQCSAPATPEHEHRWVADEDWAWRMAEMRPAPSRARLWWWRARHAWTVGLDGPWPERFLIRCLYTLGLRHSPTWMGQAPR
ncbi:hypothetical protein QDA05_gp03 [Microbacterium phage Honeyfin]|uniref:Uncharacterized protein n=3 Tax=Quhwahvirus TaxID=2733202 RepID=A0A7L7SNS4_9CAUD|nr:hypothetical protein QDA05_gp03 [Microbacterium phage Honeyfin]QOC58026.1 hypothetical protein SEA_SCUMBERLAND_3 [Microbacterium phage Scumberland]QXN74795.1 hypothetical protein SEA_PHRANCESCO_3 [Microbacterium phage Phrancesco]QZD98938.1 hypothetical protein SEA_HONEYFIN_3 [Microbacterium phage Honeyfin]WNM67706.1 hypothetical protein SEA_LITTLEFORTUNE_3 [Microbacterium phage LittleFortune]